VRSRQEQVNDTENQEVQVKSELEALGNEDSDDELFGDSNQNTEVSANHYSLMGLLICH
jgi:hypothetical protein